MVLKTRHILLRDPVNAIYVRALRIRNLQHFLESADFRFGNLPVGLRHFGGKRDQRDGKNHFIVGKRTVDDKMPCHGADKRAKGSADCESDAGACNFSPRSEEHTSELQSLMRHSYAVFCLKKK